MKKLIIISCLIFLISATAIIKTSSKKIEQEIFISKENIIMLSEKYNLVSFEYTYLSKPSRILEIMNSYTDKNYIYLDKSKFKILTNKKEIFTKTRSENDKK